MDWRDTPIFTAPSFDIGPTDSRHLDELLYGNASGQVREDELDLRPMVGSLFSGIGGLDLGLERAGFRIAWQIEVDQFCTKVLQKHWPDVPKYGDIREVNPNELQPVTLLAGGFPCQPISDAGKKLGQADERWMWPEFARIIRGLRPPYVLVENVPGLLIRGMGDVLGDLATLGYDAEWAVLSAATFGAPHLRERVFIVAYPASIGCVSGSSQARIFAKGVPSEEARAAWIGYPSRGASGRVRLLPDSAVLRMADGDAHRMDRIAALGNAVVPQVVEWLGRRIMEVIDFASQEIPPAKV